MNLNGPVGILWRFSNGCEIKRKCVKHAINVIVAVLILLNTVQFVICFTGIFSLLSLLNTQLDRYVYSVHMLIFLNASNEKTLGVWYGYGGFRGSVGSVCISVPLWQIRIFGLFFSRQIRISGFYPDFFVQVRIGTYILFSNTPAVSLLMKIKMQ